jgi:hypothetical protein
MSAVREVAEMHVKPTRPVDRTLFHALLVRGFVDAQAADTLIQAAAAVAVHRHHRHGEKVGERGQDFAEALSVTNLLYAQARGRA